MLIGQGEGTGWRQHRQTDTGNGSIGQDFGVKNATLWGGNLSMLSALLGTPYFPEVKGGILFLEDVGEHPYRIERLLTHLLNAGVLARQKAIVMGQFTEFKLTPHDKGFNLQSVLQWLRTQIKTPILTNLPFGHVATKVLLPFGAKADLIVEGRDVLLLWRT
jgi:muramoyltetrapeptide carboxypeptidase